MLKHLWKRPTGLLSNTNTDTWYMNMFPVVSQLSDKRSSLGSWVESNTTWNAQFCTIKKKKPTHCRNWSDVLFIIWRKRIIKWRNGSTVCLWVGVRACVWVRVCFRACEAPNCGDLSVCSHNTTSSHQFGGKSERRLTPTNNGAAAQHQCARDDLRLYAFARLFYFLWFLQIPLMSAASNRFESQSQRSNNKDSFSVHLLRKRFEDKISQNVSVSFLTHSVYRCFLLHRPKYI